jgi:hypothetical protein
MRMYLLAIVLVLSTNVARGQAPTVLGGLGAGAKVANSPNALIAGNHSGGTLQESPFAVLYGANAGQELRNSRYATAIGPSAARASEGGEGAIYLGFASGYFAKTSVKYSTLIGYAAARFADNNTYSNIVGYAAGSYSHRSHQSVLIGMHSGYRASDSNSLVTIGRFAGAWADNSPQSVMIGDQAGGIEKLDAQTDVASAHHVTRGIYIGSGSGKNSAFTADVVLIGTETSAAPNIENAIALGKGAVAERSNTMNVPVLRREGGGVLEVDASGNVAPTDRLAQALAVIADLQARVAALEKN